MSFSAPSLTSHPPNPNPDSFPLHPIPLSNSDLSATLSSLNNLIHHSHHTLHSLPTLLQPSKTLNANLIQCPFDPRHLVPPESLFLHFLLCPSSPNPLPNPKDILESLCYPKTLNSFGETLHHPNADLCFSLGDYVDFGSNFFYRDCPGVVCLSDADVKKRTFTLPRFLSTECVNVIGGSCREIKNIDRDRGRIFPSEYWTIRNEVEAWNDYPTTYSYGVLRAISGVAIVKECDLLRWIIANSPRYGIVIDTAMQQHIFLLFCLCFKSVLREALSLKDMLMNKQNLELNWAGMSSKCPILVQSLTWLASQISILYGATNGKLFVVNLLKLCILDGASGLLLLPIKQNVSEFPDVKEEESQNFDTNIRDVKDVKLDITREDNSNFRQTNNVDATVCSREIFVSQVAAAVAALHERSLLEDRIKSLWFSQRPTNYQLVTEHCYVSERANDERKKRPDYRPIIDHDGLPRQISSNQETTKSKTREELLAEERDYKRRRMSYRGKKIKRSTVQVMRDIIEEYMEEIKQAGGIWSPVKESEECGMVPSKPCSSHDIAIEAKNLRKDNHESSAVTVCIPSQYEQGLHTNYCNKGKAMEDAPSRSYRQPRQGCYRCHDHVEDQWNSGLYKYDRERVSISPERQRNRSRSHKHRNHHEKQEYSDGKKYDQKSSSRDRQKRNTHKNHVIESPLKNSFEDRYNPSESLDFSEEEFSFDTKYLKSDKFYREELQ